MTKRVNRRTACAILNCSLSKFAKLIETGRVSPGAGLGPRSLTWAEDEIVALRDGTAKPAPAQSQPTANAA